MPVARFQTPDGKIARFEVPEGTSPDQAIALVKQNYPSLFAPSKATQDTARFEEQIKAETAPSASARVGRGMMDVGQGLKQGYLRIKDLVAGGTEGDEYTRGVDEEIARYERDRGPEAGIDWMRLGGNVAATLPAALVPGGASVSLPIRMLSGAGSGAAASGALFTPEGESKTEQVALGSVIGGAAPAVLTGGKVALRSVWDKLTGRGAQTVIPAQLAGDLQVRLQSQGLDWNKLTQTVKDSLLGDAQAALSAGGTLDDVMLKNKALIESVGAKGSRAAVTRSPRDWQTQKNLRGIAGVGEDIVKREQDDAAAMVDYLARLRSQTGGKTGTALETGEAAIGALKAQDEAKEKAVTALYEAFRKSGAQDAAVPDVKIADALGRVADEIGVENIPAAVFNRLKEFGFAGGKRMKALTVNEADKLNRLINNNNPGHGPASTALGRLKSAVNEALLDVEPVGKAGVDTLKQARAAAAERFAEQRAGKGITAALDDVSPDRFVDKFVVKADARDLKAMLSELGKSTAGTQAVADVRGHVLDQFLLKATGATSADDVVGRAFSGARFGKALDSIAPEKLHMLFTKTEVDALRTLQKASKLLTEEVPFSDVNHSKTAAALSNLLLKVGNTPMLGKLVSYVVGTVKVGDDWLKDANARKQVSEALIGSGAKAGPRKLPPQLPGERFAPAIGGAATYQLAD